MRSPVISFLLSLTVHLGVFFCLAMVQFAVQGIDPATIIESVMLPEREQQEVTRELDISTEVSESNNVVSSTAAAVTSSIGGSASGPAIAQSKVDPSSALQDPEIEINIGEVDVAGLQELGKDLGEEQVTGEVGAIVEGYGPALSRITQEVLRHMRQRKTTVVWLFDESDSMKDDQQEIKNHFHKVYEELGIQTSKESKLKNQSEVLLTAIHSFGEKERVLTSKPTAEINEIRAAIDKIAVDESGIENTCQSIIKVINQYGPTAKRQNRKLLVIVVTDESGNDGQYIDEACSAATRMNAPVYILGREAVFGYKYARLRWVDPKYGLTHWLLINRGPETAYVESLQYDGLHDRWDAHSSGFGPYEQVRLAKESGGIFFILPHEEQDLAGQLELEKRKFQAYDMKEYEPWLVSRREYFENRDASEFRKTLAQVIDALDPEKDNQLPIQEIWYPGDYAQFDLVAEANFKRAYRAMGICHQATLALEKIKPLRAKESSQRWRAQYDLVLAQTMAYRVRLFQCCLALYLQSKNKPKFQSEKSNVWNLIRSHSLLAPDKEVISRTKADLEDLKKFEKLAREQFEFVIKTHPRTPWAYRAEYELSGGFGFEIREGFRDPRYDNLDITFPKP